MTISVEFCYVRRKYYISRYLPATDKSLPLPNVGLIIIFFKYAGIQYYSAEFK